MVVGLFWTLALVAVVGAGLAAIAGLASLRDRCAVVAVAAVLVATLLPLAASLWSTLLVSVGLAVRAVSQTAGASTISTLTAALFLLGHAALGVALVRRRRRGVEQQRRDAAELEQIRGRERLRVSVDGEDVEL